MWLFVCVFACVPVCAFISGCKTEAESMCVPDNLELYKQSSMNLTLDLQWHGFTDKLTLAKIKLVFPNEPADLN